MTKIENFLACGSVRLEKFSLHWRVDQKPKTLDLSEFKYPQKIHLAPGPNRVKPDKHWIDVDIDPTRGDVVIDFADFRTFPIATDSVACIYGSHVFEHKSIYVTPTVFKECFRVLVPGGTLRFILPDEEKSIREYAAKNTEYEIFKRRAKRAKKSGA